MTASRSLATASFICLVSLLATGCATPRAGEAPPPRAVRVDPAGHVEAPRGVRYAVTIEPAERLTLAVKAAGYVSALHQVRGDDGRMRALQPGDAVRAGTVLARLRDAEYRERVNEAEARVREAEAGRARAGLDLDRARTLFEAESLTKPDLDAAQSAFDAATARVAAAAAQAASARLALADCVLLAPVDGVVLERPLEVGVLAGVGTTAVVLGDVREVTAVFGVPDAVVARLAPGQRLTMASEAFPGEAFAGRITAIAPTADRDSRVFAIELTLANGDGRLRPGMVGVVEIASPLAAATAPQGVTVPVGAVVRATGGAGGYGVFVVESGADGERVRARAVSLGPAAGNAVVVTGGLAAGERVVTMGAALLHDGEPVRVIP